MHVPSSAPEFTVFAQWDPEQGRVAYFTLPGFNFGLKAAVPQFNRVAELTAYIAVVVLGVVCCHYFDDYNVTEPTLSAASGQRALRDHHGHVGLPF